MNIGTRARSALVAMVAVLAVGVIGAAQPASAAGLPINLRGQVDSHIGGLVNSDVTFASTFNGEADVEAGTLTGTFAAEPGVLAFNAFGLLPVKAGTELRFTEPVSGTIDLATLQVQVTSTFEIELTSFSLAGLPLLDPALTCRTATPITAELSGTFDPATGIVLEGDYAIPAFTGCGGLNDLLLSLFTSGPDNSIEATLANV
jgi:hypothetical protein